MGCGLATSVSPLEVSYSHQFGPQVREMKCVSVSPVELIPHFLAPSLIHVLLVNS